MTEGPFGFTPPPAGYADSLFRAADSIFARGERITVNGHRAVVKRADGYTLTVAYRESPFWRAVWYMQDVYWRMRVKP